MSSIPDAYRLRNTPRGALARTISAAINYAPRVFLRVDLPRQETKVKRNQKKEDRERNTRETSVLVHEHVGNPNKLKDERKNTVGSGLLAVVTGSVGCPAPAVQLIDT